MALRDLVVAGVKLANQLTPSLQVIVVLEVWLSQGGTGEPVYCPPVEYTALLERKQELITAPDGLAVVSAHKVTFIQPVAVKPADRITLPDGSQPLIINVEGLEDPAHATPGTPYLSEVWLRG